MRIILATPIYPPEIGGPATYTKELAERIKNEHELTVITYTDSQEAFSGTKLVSVSKNQPLPIRLFKYLSALTKLARNVDLIYVQNAMAAGLPVALASVLTGKPFILKFVGDEAWERASQHKLTDKRLEEFLENPEGNMRIRLMMIVQGWVLRRASIVTTPSEYLGKEIAKTYRINPKKVITNYNAAEETETLPFEPKRVKQQIATTARLVVWKGIEGIIRALTIVREKYPDARLVIAGDGPEMDNLKNLTRELKITDGVDFLGKISRAETWQLRKNSEVYVLNSTYEGLPHTVLTSFAAEIPTVATNIPGTNEAIFDNETGLLVEPGDTKELAQAIIKIFEDKDLAQKLVSNGAELLRQKFSWKAHLEKLDGFFKSVCLNPID